MNTGKHKYLTLWAYTKAPPLGLWMLPTISTSTVKLSHASATGFNVIQKCRYFKAVCVCVFWSWCVYVQHVGVWFLLKQTHSRHLPSEKHNQQWFDRSYQMIWHTSCSKGHTPKIGQYKQLFVFSNICFPSISYRRTLKSGCAW